MYYISCAKIKPYPLHIKRSSWVVLSHIEQIKMSVDLAFAAVPRKLKTHSSFSDSHPSSADANQTHLCDAGGADASSCTLSFGPAFSPLAISSTQDSWDSFHSSAPDPLAPQSSVARSLFTQQPVNEKKRKRA